MGYAPTPVINALDLSLDVGTAPRRIIDFIAYNPLFARHSTRVTRSSRPISFDAMHRRPLRCIRRGYTVFRFRRNGFKHPSRVPQGSHCLSLANAPSSRKTHPDRDGSCSYISISPRSLSGNLPARLRLSLTASQPPLHLLLFFFAPRLRSRRETSLGETLKRLVGLKRLRYSQRRLLPRI